MNTLQIYNYFDAHTHLEPARSSKTFAIRSFRAGIETPNTDLYTIGIHPYDVPNHTVVDSRIDVDPYNGKILAIGEIGLDFRFPETISQQIKIFKQQLELANTHSLPAVIHCVKAYPQTLLILKKHDCKRFMFHGFDSSFKNAQQIINTGGYISFGAKLLTYKLLQKVFETIIETYPSRILLESDESPDVMPELYQIGTKLSGGDELGFTEIIKQNFKTFYDL